MSEEETDGPRALRDLAGDLYTQSAEWRRRGHKFVAKNLATAGWEIKKAANKIEIIEYKREHGKRMPYSSRRKPGL